MANHRSELFPDELFADLFPSGTGRPSVPADVVAAVMVLQALEGLTDRDAIQQLRTSIAWKVATGLALDDPGFHPTVLTLWRNRLRGSDRPQRIFEAVREVVSATGVLATRQRRALDSTVLDDAVTRQDTITQVVAQIRVVRRLVPEARALELTAHDYESAVRKPVCAWNDPADIERVVTALVRDAHAVLEAMADQDLSPEQADAVGLLALVADQDVELGDGEGTWRIARRTAPDRIVSVHDPESRHVHKTVHAYRDGFKGHIAIEPETGLVTACELTAGDVSDAQAAPGLLRAEPDDIEVLGDSAYSAGAFRARLAARGRVAIIKPPPLQRAVRGGVHRGRLCDRPRRQHGHLSHRPHRGNQPDRLRGLRRALPWLSAAGPLHHRSHGQEADGPPALRPARRCPEAGRDPRVPGRLPPRAPDGGANSELAGAARSPPGRLPRGRAQPHLVEPPRGGGQPPAPAQPGPVSHRDRVGGGLTPWAWTPPRLPSIASAPARHCRRRCCLRGTSYPAVRTPCSAVS